MYSPITSTQQICGFEVIDQVGHGARSTIFAVKDKLGQVYALKRVIKRVPEDQRFLDQALSEHDIASKLNHPKLRRSLRLIRQRSLIRTREVVLLMEMVDGLSLDHSRPTDLTLACKVCQQVAVGLKAMHEAGYVHADIKPNNILVTDEQGVKIIDFGQSCEAGTIKQRIQGTPDYIAPEQVLRQPISPRTDVFNLGATMYWLMTGKHVPTLIPKGEPGLALKTDDACPPPHQVNPDVPPALSSLVMGCIQAEPHQRPESMARVYDRLEMAIAQLARRN